MKLVKARVQSYRSIVDSDEVNIDEKLTVLIGKNEQGKTNFLKALKSFNKEETYAHKDLPSHLHVALDNKEPSKIPIATLWFELNPDDKDNLKDIITQTDELKQLKIIKFYDNHYTSFAVYNNKQEEKTEFAPPDISQQIEAIKNITTKLQTKLDAHCTRIPAFAATKPQYEKIINDLITANYTELTQIDNLIKTFATAIKSLPSQDPPIKTDIANTEKELGSENTKIKAISNTDKLNLFIDTLPRFIFHSTIADKIPDSVPIETFVKDAEKVSKGMNNLCLISGLSSQQLAALSQKVTRDRTSYEEHYKSTLSGKINKIWSQEKYDIHFRIEKDTLSVNISDNTYTKQVPPSERSDGFQWFLSFYVTQASIPSANSVILLDNPALELHLDGQKDIRRFLENDVASPSSQVIYVTHSPGMVDPFKIEQVRAVELLSDNKGTKIHNKIPRRGDGFDILQSLRSFLGSSVAYSLLCNKYNILVEGDSDKYILEGMIEKIDPDMIGEICINGRLAEEESCSLSRYFFSEGFNFVCLLDADSSGRDIKKKLISYGIPKEKIILLSDVFTDRTSDFEIEDIINADLYYSAAQKAFSNISLPSLDEINQRSESKTTKRYKVIFDEINQVGFNKTPVAEALKEILKGQSTLDDTLTPFRSLLKHIIAKLKPPQADLTQQDLPAVKPVSSIKTERKSLGKRKPERQSPGLMN